MHPPILEGAREARWRSRAALPGRASRRGGLLRFGLVAGAMALGAGAVAAGGAPSGPTAPGAASRDRPGCPAHARRLVEHFVAADCLDCWAGRAGMPGAEPWAGGDWSLDWILPGASAAESPLAAAALGESADRLARLNPGLVARLELPPAAFDAGAMLALPDPRRRLWIHSSLPFNGYFGVQMHARGAWPAGSTGWIALVELQSPDFAGSTVPRHLVRAVVGPVALPVSAGTADAVAPLFGMRWPASSSPERLSATAWIEGRDGRVLQITSDRCADPR